LTVIINISDSNTTVWKELNLPLLLLSQQSSSYIIKLTYLNPATPISMRWLRDSIIFPLT